jgi:hypothetical protein
MMDKKDMIVLEESILEEYSLSKMIRNMEDIVTSYKELLKDASMDKEHFSIDNELVIWYKADLRESKAICQSTLKDLVKEKEYENQGLNSPYCYKY